MKTIGLLGGTGWSSTISYYTLINKMVNDRLKGHHSAIIHLRSIDYHEIMQGYEAKDHAKIETLLKKELLELFNLNPDCFIICCNSLHKYYDLVEKKIKPGIPILHTVDLTAKYINEHYYKKVLLLATKFTLDDTFFAFKLEKNGIEVITPSQAERDKISKIHSNELMHNRVTDSARSFFKGLIEKYDDAEAIVLACTEFPMVVTEEICGKKPIIAPVTLQCASAVEFAID